jgi:hypothetical protein
MTQPRFGGRRCWFRCPWSAMAYSADAASNDLFTLEREILRLAALLDLTYASCQRQNKSLNQ